MRWIFFIKKYIIAFSGFAHTFGDIYFFLLDFSQYYSKLNMKSLLQTTTSNGAVILICEPQRDL